MATGPGVMTRVAVALEGIEDNGLAVATTGKLPSDPSGYNTVRPDPRFVLGGVYFYGAGIYRYVQFLDAVTYAAGQLLYCAAANGTKVTNDYNGGTGVATNSLIPVGVCLGVMTQNYYGFMQIWGPGSVLCNNDDDAVGGDNLITTAVDGGLADVTADPNPSKYIGYCLGAVNATTNLVAAHIQLM